MNINKTEAPEINRLPRLFTFLHFYIVPMQLVVPSAVRIAVAMDAMICSVHFKVSFFDIVSLLPEKNILLIFKWLGVRE